MSETTQPVFFREIETTYTGPQHKPIQIREARNVLAFLQSEIGAQAREHFVAFYLDARHNVIGYQIVSIGTATASLVHPREVFQPAIGIGACALIIAHNHPSGDAMPSPEDVQITERLTEAGKVLGIPLLDSLIIARNGFYAFREQAPASLR